MKHLRQYIRKILLTEAAYKASDLPAGIVVVHEDNKIYGNIIKYKIYLEDGTLEDSESEDGPWGWIMIEPLQRGKYGDCGKAWKVSGSEAASGWGPLLYDCAIEIATQIAGGLMPDRMGVSREANNVWDYYMNNRADVQKTQLDNLEDSFKDGPENDCEQMVGDQLARNENVPWLKSSMSKRYSKEPTTINALKQAGKWIEE